MQPGNKGVRGAICAVLLLVLAFAPAASEAAFPEAKNGLLAFSGDQGPQDDLFTIAADGSGAVNITNSAAPLTEAEPVFSPDGRRIVFERFNTTTGEEDLWSARPDGTDQSNLTNTPTMQEFSAAFTPDGRSLLFPRCDLTVVECELWISKPDGSNPVQLTFTTGIFEFDPAVSPDGKRIAFRRDPGNTDRDIWIMNLDGSGAVNLTNTPAASLLRESRPSFSGDGKTIYFDRFVDGGAEGDIFKMTTAGAGVTNLTNTPTILDTEAAPSPDGKRLAFASCVVECEIVVSDANGQGIAPVTNTPAAEDRDPDWEPIPRCGKRRATIVGDDGPDKLKGTKKADVIVANGGKDKVNGRGGNDRICLGAGKDKAVGGGGEDRCIGGAGKDKGASCEKGKL